MLTVGRQNELPGKNVHDFEQSNGKMPINRELNEERLLFEELHKNDVEALFCKKNKDFVDYLSSDKLAFLTPDEIDQPWFAFNGKTILTEFIVNYSNSNKEIVAYISRFNAMPNARDINGKTALHYLLSRDIPNIDVLKNLLSIGFDPKIADNCGCTPIMYAIANQKVWECLPIGSQPDGLDNDILQGRISKWDTVIEELLPQNEIDSKSTLLIDSIMKSRLEKISLTTWHLERLLVGLLFLGMPLLCSMCLSAFHVYGLKRNVLYFERGFKLERFFKELLIFPAIFAIVAVFAGVMRLLQGNT
jgi:hypothetical protein